MKTNRPLYRQLRAAKVPFVDAHKIAKFHAHGKRGEIIDLVRKADWSKPGYSNYKWNEFDEESYSYASYLLPNGKDYLIDYSHSNIYVDNRMPF